MPTTVIIDYGSGNLRSVQKALERAARESNTSTEVLISSDPKQVADAARIVLPGVGAFGDCIGSLRGLDGIEDALNSAVRDRKVPFLGICVGMQLLADVGREHGDHQGLGWISGEVVPLAPADPTLNIPHMGWNELVVSKPKHTFLNGISTGDHAYFAHSYQFKPAVPETVMAHVEFGGAACAAIAKANIFGTQFHPEKSQATGLRLLSNFLTWKPKAENTP